MADIKIAKLKVEKNQEIIDLKTEAEKGNSGEFSAFRTVRGGVSAAAKWCCHCH